MGQGGCGGDRYGKATVDASASVKAGQGQGVRPGEVAAARSDNFDCPGGERYLANAELRKRFTRTNAVFDNAWGSTDINIRIENSSADLAIFGGQSGHMGGMGGHCVDDDVMQVIHNEASSNVEYLGKAVWR